MRENDNTKYRRQTKGKCATCRIVYYWDPPQPRLSDARCPGCGAALARTSSLIGDGWRHEALAAAKVTR